MSEIFPFNCWGVKDICEDRLVWAFMNVMRVLSFCQAVV